MEDALAGRAPAKVFQPPGITTMKISPDTGEAAAPGDANAIFEFFCRERAPGAQQHRSQYQGHHKGG
ncbi:MAG: hypothetical protein CM15mP68_5260 [Pseudomonadota bacterium]|nr:MAG: hypothetical protein CM15mP68_5260 [Pseudomonadota bacterium]